MSTDDRPLLYDVFSGAGGAGRGYQMAGFRVIGIDNKPQPRYPCDGFIQMDAFEFFAAVKRGEFEAPAVWHASPPCQRYSRITPPGRRHEHPDLIPPVRERLRACGRPWVIENVDCAPLDGISLCGVSFGLNFYKHRLFESSVMLFAPPHCKHPAANSLSTIVESDHETISRAIGIDWMRSAELRQAIPPVYTEYVGHQLLTHLTSTLSFSEPFPTSTPAADGPHAIPANWSGAATPGMLCVAPLQLAD